MINDLPLVIQHRAFVNQHGVQQRTPRNPEQFITAKKLD